MGIIHFKRQKDTLQSAKENALRDCKLFFGNKFLNPVEARILTCWECRDGWNEEIAKLSYAIEALNIEYRKYRVTCRAAQIKEKYGRLCVYTHMHECDYVWRDNLWKPINWLYNWLDDINYRKIQIIDSPTKEYDDIIDITEDEVASKQKYYKNVSNVDVINTDGKWQVVCHLMSPAKTHWEPTRFKVLFKIKQLIWRLMCTRSYPKSTAIQRVFMTELENKVHELVYKAVDKCYNICEECGASIGYDDKHPRVTPDKYYTQFLCTECAERYIKKYESE